MVLKIVQKYLSSFQTFMSTLLVCSDESKYRRSSKVTWGCIPWKEPCMDVQQFCTKIKLYFNCIFPLTFWSTPVYKCVSCISKATWKWLSFCSVFAKQNRWEYLIFIMELGLNVEIILLWDLLIVCFSHISYGESKHSSNF